MSLLASEKSILGDSFRIVLKYYQESVDLESAVRERCHKCAIFAGI